MFLTFFMMVKAAFQSTLPHGSDRGHCRISDPTAQFQSTLPYGSDFTAANVGKQFKVISIHAPLRERQFFQQFLDCHHIHFNPRSLTGATGKTMSFADNIKISIHAPLRERPLLSSGVQFPSLFQSTLPRGSDHS